MANHVSIPLSLTYYNNNLSLKFRWRFYPRVIKYHYRLHLWMMHEHTAIFYRDRVQGKLALNCK